LKEKSQAHTLWRTALEEDMDLSYEIPTLPPDVADLKVRIIEAVKNIDAPMLTSVWQELEYRIDVCRVTRGNISSCQKKKTFSVFLWL
jgi:hypothetical protein